MAQSNLNMRIDKDLKEAAQNVADSKGRTLTSVINSFLEVYSGNKEMSVPLVDEHFMFDGPALQCFSMHDALAATEALHKIFEAVSCDTHDTDADRWQNAAMEVYEAVAYQSFVWGLSDGFSKACDVLGITDYPSTPSFEFVYRYEYPHDLKFDILDCETTIDLINNDKIPLDKIYSIASNYSDHMLSTSDVVVAIDRVSKALRSFKNLADIDGAYAYIYAVTNVALPTTFEGDLEDFKSFQTDVMTYCYEFVVNDLIDKCRVEIGDMYYGGTNLPKVNAHGYDLDPNVSYKIISSPCLDKQFRLFNIVYSDVELCKDYDDFVSDKDNIETLSDKTPRSLWHTNMSQGLLVQDSVTNKWYVLVEYSKDVAEVGGKHVMMVPSLSIIPQ